MGRRYNDIKDMPLTSQRERERMRKRERKYFIHQFIIWPLKLYSLCMYIQEQRRDYTKAPADLLTYLLTHLLDSAQIVHVCYT